MVSISCVVCCKILIHTKAHACDKHHPKGNDGLLMRPHFHSAAFLFLYRFFFHLEHDISIPFFLLLNSASPDKVLLPVAIVQISVAYRVASVVHLVISHIDTDVGYIRSRIVGTVEEHQIPSLCL